MIDLAIDNNADLVFDTDVGTVTGVEEVKQNVALTLRTRMGEFFADAQMGLDWDYVIGKDYNEQYAAAAITDAIQEDPRVTSVGSITLQKDSERRLNVYVSFTVDDSIQTGMEVAIVA